MILAGSEIHLPQWGAQPCPTRFRSLDRRGEVPQSGRQRTPVPVTLRTRFSDEIAVCYCAGMLRAGDAMEFRSELRKLLPDHPSVVLECGQLESIDSGGLGALVAIYTSFRSFGGDIRLAAVNGAVLGMLEVCGLASIIRIFPAEVEAVRSYLPHAAGE